MHYPAELFNYCYRNTLYTTIIRAPICSCEEAIPAEVNGDTGLMLMVNVLMGVNGDTSVIILRVNVLMGD